MKAPKATEARIEGAFAYMKAFDDYVHFMRKKDLDDSLYFIKSMCGIDLSGHRFSKTFSVMMSKKNTDWL